jgi:ABC-type lipopolysaccharide export system ATPase subunit
MNQDAAKHALLEFDMVSCLSTHDTYATVKEMNLKMASSQLIYLNIPSKNINLPIADLACGLRQPSAGRVLFQGASWSSRTFFDECSLRAGIRRNHHEEAWVSNLNVQDNLLLAARHHSKTSEKSLKSELDELCDLLGLSSIPRIQPALVNRHALRRYDWLRMFLGKPSLLVLSRPLQHEHDPDSCDRFIALIDRHLSAGCSCFWMDDQSLPTQLQAHARLCYNPKSFKVTEE